ncbi:quinone oxidoreductase family protein [Noviherbaspirillum massiliense]|uniref:quinone oxidoreductase family protein n=1 Tax=Noviherbaspirillum massiliense TaxID=1465823 RepID=UPI0004745B1E|nr:quinone oxidoreductase [Noviherbaspirillum massiliense]
MMKTLSEQVRIHAFGAACELRAETIELPPLAAECVRVRHAAVGVNFVDVYHRTGLYALPSLPATLGVEGAGVIEEVGAGVSHLRAGQRVAYAGPPVGSYASVRDLPAERAIPLPDGIPCDQAAGAMLRGITAHMLFRYVRPIAAGDTVLVHAAAGGLGLVLVQWAKALGARVIGTVGSSAKAELALAHGLDCAVLYREQNFVAAVKEFTNGEGVHFAIDGIGGETVLRTLEAVRPYGMVASIGQVAGDIALLDTALLGPSRSIAFSRPGVFRFMSDLQRYREGAKATLERLAGGMKISVGMELPLSRAEEAHRMLEAGATTGSLLLRP